MLRFATAVVLLLLQTSAAHAATAQVELRSGRYFQESAVLVVRGVGDEANRLTLAAEPAGGWTVTDEGAPVVPGEGCRAIGAAARCVPPPVPSGQVEIDAGAGDDLVRALGDLSVRAEGGTGHDLLVGSGRLSGGAGNDILVGGATSDWLHGGPGRDVLRGAGGDDMLSGDGSPTPPRSPAGEDDVLDGGPGIDSATYTERLAGVRGDLARSRAGAGDEQDRLIAVEGLTGGSGNDRLVGDDGDNRLSGAGGDDILEGRRGADTLNSGAGVNRLSGGGGADELLGGARRDLLRGGPGDDRLSSRSGSRMYGESGDDVLVITRSPAVLSCGTGRDVIAGTLAGERVDGCEYASFGGFGLLTMATAPTLRAGRELRTEARCPARPGLDLVCRGTLEIALRRTGRSVMRLGTAPFEVPAGRRGTARLLLDARARRTLRGQRHPVLRLHLEATTVLAAPAPVGPPSLSGSWVHALKAT